MKDLEFAGAERSQRIAGRPLLGFGEESGAAQQGRNVDAALADEDDCIPQVASRTILQQVSVRAGAQGPTDGVLLSADGEDDELGGATSGSQLAHDFSSIQSRHMQVEDGEIGLQLSLIHI